MMKIGRHKGIWSSLSAYLLPAVFFMALLSFLVVTMNGMATDAAAEGLRSTEEGIRKAAVHCYAVEGQYPPDLAYLENNYGLTIDRKRYVVFYDCFATNIVPEVTVFSLAEQTEMMAGEGD